jgi:cytoplasmic iron level regulating protein YaaA (DUF328/UPF0246 family)
VLILLPPSETKAAPRRRGRPVDLATLGLPELTPTRAAVRDALVAASGAPGALDLLGVGEGLRAEVEQNTRLGSTPASGALETYTGVLYDALDFAALSPGAKRRAGRALRVQSALWGPVGPADRITPYRLSMAVTLPGLGPLARLWRAVLPGPMAALAGDGVVVDCRSSTYAAAWSPRGEAARQLLAVRVFTEVAGRRTVVSHLAKHTRGQIARVLLEHPGRLRTVADVTAAVAADGHRCELVDHGRRGCSLDVLR